MLVRNSSLYSKISPKTTAVGILSKNVELLVNRNSLAHNTLYLDPSVLVLDEATSSLDTATERDVMDAVRALHGEKTLIIVAHRLSTVEDCDRLYRLEQGTLVDEGDTSVVLSGVHRKYVSLP